PPGPASAAPASAGPASAGRSCRAAWARWLLLDDLGALERLHHVIDGRGYCRGGRISQLFDVDGDVLDRFGRRRARGLVDHPAEGDRPAELRGEGRLDIATDAFAAVAVHLVGEGIDGGVAVDRGEATGLVEGLGLRAELA